MIGEPWFWRERTIAARAASLVLAPAAIAYDTAQRVKNAAIRPWRAPVPVFCVGNATLGGVGKTPFAALLARHLDALGAAPHFLTRGHGGALAGPVRVDPGRHTAAGVGDEALLLAAEAPTWVSRNRPAGARASAEAGARSIVMDDGFQNPSLEKTLSFLIIDAEDPAGNGAVFPAGPLREPVSRAASRAGAIVLIGSDTDATLPAGEPPIRPETPRFRAWLAPEGPFTPRRVLAFCGIGRPQRFEALLRRCGFDIAAFHSFRDHHPFTPAELAQLRRAAKEKNASLLTTAKDLARLPAEERADIAVLPVVMSIDDPARLDAALTAALAGFARESEPA